VSSVEPRRVRVSLICDLAMALRGVWTA
jgi:hypothetical protein